MICVPFLQFVYDFFYDLCGSIRGPRPLGPRRRQGGGAGRGESRGINHPPHLLHLLLENLLLLLEDVDLDAQLRVQQGEVDVLHLLGLELVLLLQGLVPLPLQRLHELAEVVVGRLSEKIIKVRVDFAVL